MNRPIRIAYEGGISPDAHDGPYMLIVETESTGAMFFGPYRSYEVALRRATRVTRLGEDRVGWSIEALQPGSFLAEWLRIIREDLEAAAS